MNIAIDIRALVGAKISGVPNYIENLLREIVKDDRTNNYFLFYNGYKIIKNKDEGIPIIKTNYSNKFLNFSLRFLNWPKLDKLMEGKIGQKIDIFFLPDPRPCALSTGVKKVTTFHDLSFERFSEFFSFKTRLWHWLLNPKNQALSSDLIIAVSQFTKQELHQVYGIENKKIKVIHHGVSDMFKTIEDEIRLQKIRKKYDLPERFVLSLSTLEPRKNIEGLIKAFLSLRENTVNPIELVIAGEKNENIFKTLRLELKEGVKMIGFVSEEDQAALYSLAQCLVFPSFYEGFGFPVLEAAKCGCPVVTSENSAMNELLGEGAVYVDPHNVDSIAEGILEALKKKNDRVFLENAKKRADEFSWEKCAEETVEALERSIGN